MPAHTDGENTEQRVAMCACGYQDADQKQTHLWETGVEGQFCRLGCVSTLASECPTCIMIIILFALNEIMCANLLNKL